MAGRQAASVQAAGSRDQPGETEATSWWATKAPVIRFVLTFAVLMGLFYGVFYTPPWENPTLDRFIDSYLCAYADVSGAVLRLLGEDARVQGPSITSSRFSVRIVRGCDAMEATALVVCAVLAAPVGVWRKVAGVVGGVVILALANLIRIITLFYTGMCYPKLFDAMHKEVWQGMFIVLAIVL